jgi:hypothetical protein
MRRDPFTPKRRQAGGIDYISHTHVVRKDGKDRRFPWTVTRRGETNEPVSAHRALGIAKAAAVKDSYLQYYMSDEHQALIEEAGYAPKPGYHFVISACPFRDHNEPRKLVEEADGTPWSCSVASETYWCS